MKKNDIFLSDRLLNSLGVWPMIVCHSVLPPDNFLHATSLVSRWTRTSGPCAVGLSALKAPFKSPRPKGWSCLKERKRTISSSVTGYWFGRGSDQRSFVTLSFPPDNLLHATSLVSRETSQTSRSVGGYANALKIVSVKFWNLIAEGTRNIFTEPVCSTTQQPQNTFETENELFFVESSIFCGTSSRIWTAKRL